MSDLKLFTLKHGKASELSGKSIALEKSLQTVIERNLDPLLGITFIETEYSTGKTHRGRIDTLGIDENGCPVIIEYKRAVNENVVNQGLFYIDWLLDHKAEFEMLVLNKLGKKIQQNIDWSTPRLLCIAGDFTRYDEHAVQQINRNIELVRYKLYGKELLLLELVNATSADPVAVGGPKGKATYKTASQALDEADEELRNRYEALRSYLLAMGNDVQEKTLKFYIAFKRIKNFACVELRNQVGHIHLFLKVDPSKVKLVKGFSRDVRKIGHFGTGELEITVRSDEDLEKAKEFIHMSYEAS